jgi:hypothetical protein
MYFGIGTVFYDLQSYVKKADMLILCWHKRIKTQKNVSYKPFEKVCFAAFFVKIRLKIR